MNRYKHTPNEGNPAGSPVGGEPAFLVIGRIRRPHGLHGELLMEVITDFPERLKPDVTVYVGESHQPLRIRSQRWQSEAMLLAFDAYPDPETAGELRNQLVYVHTDDRPPLPEDEYYHHQLLGLRVISDDNVFLGTLSHILDTGANDVYVVQPETGPEILLPAIKSVILKIDLTLGEMTVHLLPGLIDE